MGTFTTTVGKELATVPGPWATNSFRVPDISHVRGRAVLALRFSRSIPWAAVPRSWVATCTIVRSRQDVCSTHRSHLPPNAPFHPFLGKTSTGTAVTTQRLRQPWRLCLLRFSTHRLFLAQEYKSLAKTSGKLWWASQKPPSISEHLRDICTLLPPTPPTAAATPTTPTPHLKFLNNSLRYKPELPTAVLSKLTYNL